MKKILTITVCLFVTVAMYGQYKGGLWSYTYDMAFGMGATSDFIEPASFRGMSISGSGFVAEKIAIGGQITWNTFFEKTARVQDFDLIDDEGELVTGTLAGTQYRYINSFPLLVTARYFSKNPVFEDFAVFGGLGIGTSIIKRRIEVGIFAVDELKWHFTLAPEVGLVYGFTQDFNLFFSAQYFYSLKTNEAPEHTHLSLHLGFASTF